MRRRSSAKEPPKSSIQRCASCGATASASALRCTICGHPFASAGRVSDLWGPVGSVPESDDPPLLDLYASERAAGQPDLESAPPETDPKARPVVGPTTDPWASGSGTLSTLPGKPASGAFVAPGSDAKKTVSGSRGSGLRRTLIVLLLLVVVGGAAAWFAGRPFLSQQLAGTVGGAVDDGLEAVSALPVDRSGRVTIVERDITTALRANADAYAPITDPRVALSRNGVRITFTLYGQAHTLTGTLAVDDGRIVMVDPALVGPASRLVDVTEVAASTEESISDMFARLDARPLSVKTSDDTLVITTEPT